MDSPASCGGNSKASLRQTLFALAVAMSIATTARAQLAQYAAPGGSFNPTSVAARVSAGPLNDTGSSADLQPGIALTNSVFLEQLVASTDASAAVANNQFFQFHLAPEPGFHLNLSSFSFDAARGGSSTPRGWVVRSSVDGFSSNLGTADIPTAQPTLTSFAVNLSAPAFQNLTSALDFRIYGYAPTASGVGLFFDNLTVNGTVSGPALVKYEALGGGFAPTTLADQVLASNLNDIGSAASLDTGVALPNSVFLQQLIVSPDAAAAVANEQFFQFTASAATGFELDLLNMTFDAGKGGSSSPRGWVLRSSLDGFTSDIASADIPTVQPTLTGFDVDLSGALFQHITSQVTFRLYDYAPGGSGTGTFYDNIALNGVVQVVPEPTSTLVVLGPGALALLRRRARSRPGSRLRN